MKLDDKMHLIICTTSSVFPNLLIGIPLITESKPSLVSSLYRSRTSGVSTALGIRQFTWILGDNSNAKHFVNANPLIVLVLLTCGRVGTNKAN